MNPVFPGSPEHIAIVETWTRGWAVAREVPSVPVWENGGLKTEVGWADQKTRYVFPYFNDDFVQLMKVIKEPWVSLKTYADPEDVKRVLQHRWVIQQVGYMMTYTGLPAIIKPELQKEYILDITEKESVIIVKVVTLNGEQASIGRTAIINDYVIYDRVETNALHQRKGLASVVMRTLEAIAASRGKTKGILVATDQGKKLYETLGWKLHSLYTSVVIPG